MVNKKLIQIISVFIFALFMSSNLSFAKPIDFELQDLNGNVVKLSSFRGKNILLFFWTSSCKICSKYYQKAEKLYPELKSKDIVLLSVNVFDSKSRAESFKKKENISYPVLLDTDGKVAWELGVSGVPNFIYVNKQGNAIQQLYYLSDHPDVIFAMQ